jgi:hypothetical protein
VGQLDLKIADRCLRLCQHSFSTVFRDSLWPDRLPCCLELLHAVFAVWLTLSMDDGDRHLSVSDKPPPLRL